MAVAEGTRNRAERRVRARLSRALRAVGIPVTAGQAASQTVYSCIAALEVNVLNCRRPGEVVTRA
jgi:hypothetical protein